MPSIRATCRLEPGSAAPVPEANYKESIGALKKVANRSEDLQMHYTAMLAYRGIGDTAQRNGNRNFFSASRPRNLLSDYSQPRLVSPEDNNERQAIHDHESIDLKAVKASDSGRLRKGSCPSSSCRSGWSYRRMEARLRFAPRPGVPASGEETE